jgi:glycosyltransferase involved in cell wall biosynthesis
VKINILHICNDFSNSEVYSQLYIKLEDRNENQLIFHPLRNIVNKGKRENQFNSSKTRIIYSQPLKKYHKLFFNSKINFLYKSLISQINPSSIKITIATTLYSDGAIALKLFQEFNIPYVVCVRHTDINFFSKYRSDMNSLLKKILQNAKKVVFISPTLELKAKKIKKWSNCFSQNKNILIPNGIDQFWLNNIYTENKSSRNSFLFIGKLDSNKNYKRLIQAFKLAHRENNNLTLTIIGNSENNIQRLIKNKPFIEKKEHVSSKADLMNYYRTHKNFVMFSINETFGLVYIEALSQGLQIGYSYEQGVYSVFSEFDRYSANPKSIKSIKNSILMMSQSSTSSKIELDRFNWDNVTDEYLRIILFHSN